MLIPAHPATLIAALLSVLLFLLVASGIALWVQYARPMYSDKTLWLKVRTWWFIVVFLCAVLLLHHAIAVLLLAVLSSFVLREYLALIAVRPCDKRVLPLLYLTIPLQYYFAYQNWLVLFMAFIPVYGLLLLPALLAVQPQGFLRAVGSLYWGLMIAVFSLSHLAYLLVISLPASEVYSGNTLLCFLLLLTQLNDVAQYIWGKAFGVRKMMPHISPHKTWVGFLGGIATTLMLAYWIAPWLTPFSKVQSVLLGLLIACAGFAGDMVASALKRDVGVKDSGNLLPGHGGILDRVDSLIYTAPLYFYYVTYLLRH